MHLKEYYILFLLQANYNPTHTHTQTEKSTEKPKDLIFKQKIQLESMSNNPIPDNDTVFIVYKLSTAFLDLYFKKPSNILQTVRNETSKHPVKWIRNYFWKKQKNR